ncbi:ribonucleoside triphosphate reductase, partial [Achromobacter ruhlandii]
MQLQHILKRDGRVVAFDRAKIAAAIAAAGRGTGELDADVAQALTGAVIEALAAEGNVCPGVETIQNQVEETRVKAGSWRHAPPNIASRETPARP